MGGFNVGNSPALQFPAGLGMARFGPGGMLGPSLPFGGRFGR
jgi:hypothetical protein